MRRTAPHLSVPRLALPCCLLLGVLLGACGAHHPGPPPILSPADQERLTEVRDSLLTMLLIEMMRPAEALREREDFLNATHSLRIALRATRDLADPLHHFDGARNLGLIYTGGTALGWPGAGQTAHYFLQRAQALNPNAPDIPLGLGILHLLHGDATGAMDYLGQVHALGGSELFPALPVLMAQALLMAGRRVEARAALHQIPPETEDPMLLALQELMHLAIAQETWIFHFPATFTREPHRPPATRTALRFPHILYRNDSHGFIATYPYDWTLFDERTDLSLAPCIYMAELTLDLPIPQGENPALSPSRIRLFALPIRAQLALPDFEAFRLPDYPYPQEVLPMISPLPEAHHYRFHEAATKPNKPDLSGELVFHIVGQMGYFFHFVSATSNYPVDQAAFHAFLEAFSFHPPAPRLPPGCQRPQAI